MRKPAIHDMRRFASTIFVLIALFVACVGAGAPRAASASMADVVSPCATPHDLAHQAIAADTWGDADDQAALPSIEDNGGGLDDTFDIPREHGIAVSPRRSHRPAGTMPDPHAHHPSLDLRPPIA